MRFHRVTWVADNWADRAPTDPGHPLYVPIDRQGYGRFDNPHRYVALYGARTDVAAVGETFGNSAQWLAGEITRTIGEGGNELTRCLVTYHLPNGKLLDLDDPQVLVDVDMRPSDVVRRNRDHTREKGLRLWLDHHDTAVGLSWWSYWRPEWTVVMLWDDLASPRFEMLTVDHATALRPDLPALVVAADVLHRTVVN